MVLRWLAWNPRQFAAYTPIRIIMLETKRCKNIKEQPIIHLYMIGYVNYTHAPASIDETKQMGTDWSTFIGLFD